MTLLLSISAVDRLADPGAAVADATRWSDHVGVVGNGTERVEDVEAYVDGIDADPDLVAGRMDGSLAEVRQRLGTDRHVLVGTTEDQRSVANALGWEFLDVEEAAAAADWALADASGD